MGFGLRKRKNGNNLAISRYGVRGSHSLRLGALTLNLGTTKGGVNHGKTTARFRVNLGNGLWYQKWKTLNSPAKEEARAKQLVKTPLPTNGGWRDFFDLIAYGFIQPAIFFYIVTVLESTHAVNAFAGWMSYLFALIYLVFAHIRPQHTVYWGFGSTFEFWRIYIYPWIFVQLYIVLRTLTSSYHMW